MLILTDTVPYCSFNPVMTSQTCLQNQFVLLCDLALELIPTPTIQNTIQIYF